MRRRRSSSWKSPMRSSRGVAQRGRDVAEDHDVALRLVQGHEVGGGRELLVEGAAQGEGHVDHVGEELPAEQRPHAPQPEGRRPLGALHGPQAAVVLGQAGRGRIEQVGRVLPEGLEAVAPCRGRTRRRSRPGTKSILWASQTTLSARSRPATRCRCRSLKQAAPPWAASTCSQTSCRRQTSAMSSSGSKAPIGVAQAQATTATIGRLLRPQAGQFVVQTAADPCGAARRGPRARSAGCPGRGCRRLGPRCNGRRREPPARAADAAAPAVPRAAGQPVSQTSPRATFRAVSRAVRLASEPPCVTAPAKVSGRPADGLAQARWTMACSTAVAHGPIS